MLKPQFKEGITEFQWGDLEFGDNVLEFLQQQTIKYLKEYEELCLKYGLVILAGERVMIAAASAIKEKIQKISV